MRLFFTTFFDNAGMQEYKRELWEAINKDDVPRASFAGKCLRGLGIVAFNLASAVGNIVFGLGGFLGGAYLGGGIIAAGMNPLAVIAGVIGGAALGLAVGVGVNAGIIVLVGRLIKKACNYRP